MFPRGFPSLFSNDPFRDPFFSDPLASFFRQPFFEAGPLYPSAFDNLYAQTYSDSNTGRRIYIRDANEPERAPGPVHIEELEDHEQHPHRSHRPHSVEEPTTDEDEPEDVTNDFMAQQQQQQQQPPMQQSSRVPRRARQVDQQPENSLGGALGSLFGNHKPGHNNTGGASLFGLSSSSSWTGSGGRGGTVFSSTSTTRTGPGGVLSDPSHASQLVEHQETVRDGRTERATVSRHLGHQGQTVTRTRDAAGQSLLSHQLHGIGQDEAAAFEQRWHQQAQASLLPMDGPASRDRQTRQQWQRQQQLGFGGRRT